jgi:hypothetical protein
LIEYENSNDSSEVEDDDIDENEGYKALINESVNERYPLVLLYLYLLPLVLHHLLVFYPEHSNAID